MLVRQHGVTTSSCSVDMHGARRYNRQCLCCLTHSLQLAALPAASSLPAVRCCGLASRQEPHLVHFACCEVVVTCECDIQEAFIVAKVQVRLECKQAASSQAGWGDDRTPFHWSANLGADSSAAGCW